jgi:hypothetical protein
MIRKSPEQEQEEFLALVFSRRGLLMLIASAAFIFFLGYVNATLAECSTDSECALLCPLFDEDCDGGPQS